MAIFRGRKEGWEGGVEGGQQELEEEGREIVIKYKLVSRGSAWALSEETAHPTLYLHLRER